MSNCIELKNVSFVYGKGTPFEKKALSNINVAFEKGKITGLIGHTGCGKSTLVNLLNGLYRPTEGEVYLDGENIWDKPKEIAKIRYRVGLVMQYPEYQLFDETVRKDIAFGPKNQGLDDIETAKRVSEAVAFTGIGEDILDKSPFEISGGQKRRAAIAGIVAMRPEVLVLDEPAAGLDPGGRREILEGLCKYVKEYNASVILVSHSMEDMAHYCDNVVVMHKSKIIKTGTVDEVFGDFDEISEIGLDIPSVSKIAKRLKSEGVDLQGTLYTVEGLKDAIIEYIRRGKL